MTQILHITSADQWAAAQHAGAYRGDTLDSEGFIHCSTPQQVVAVAGARFHGQRGLVLLDIDTDRVIPEIRWEAAENGQQYPHIYGPLNPDAVVRVHEFPPEPDGSFTLPPAAGGTHHDQPSTEGEGQNA
jgi:uncharacterized protein (DUF952 family)